MPSWGLQPNQPLQLKVKKDQMLMPVDATADMNFRFTASWESYTDAQPTSNVLQSTLYPGFT